MEGVSLDEYLAVGGLVRLEACVVVLFEERLFVGEVQLEVDEQVIESGVERIAILGCPKGCVHHCVRKRVEFFVLTIYDGISALIGAVPDEMQILLAGFYLPLTDDAARAVDDVSFIDEVFKRLLGAGLVQRFVEVVTGMAASFDKRSDRWVGASLDKRSDWCFARSRVRGLIEARGRRIGAFGGSARRGALAAPIPASCTRGDGATQSRPMRFYLCRVFGVGQLAMAALQD